METIALTPPRLTTFLLKVASRCNLVCDYCYMYEHSDQSWRDQPHVMDTKTRRLVAERLAEYAEAVDLAELLVVFHGGEPLLAGAETLAAFAEEIRRQLPDCTKVHISLQSNGTLLDEPALDVLEAADIGVSLSLDGPPAANDLHRLTPREQSSFASVRDGLHRLRARPQIFTGVIAVIDPVVPPDEILAFFAGERVSALDLLLPDANYLRPPPGRDQAPGRYTDWLIRAFDLWFDEYPDLRLRTFDALVSAVLGLPSPTDAFGFGDVSLLSIETDGTYHDLDVLKITQPGQTALGAHVASHSIVEVASSAKLAAHRRLLTFVGLASSCQTCPVVNVCGGGAVPHRYSADGFANPTIYCAEMLALIKHIERRVATALDDESRRRSERGSVDRVDLRAFELAATAEAVVDELVGEWREEAAGGLRSVAKVLLMDASLDASVTEAARTLSEAAESELGRVAIRPSVVLWARVAGGSRTGNLLRTLDGTPVLFDPAYVRTVAEMLREPADGPVRVHRNDIWLRAPFSEPIAFVDDTAAEAGRTLARQALALIEGYDPALASEIRLLSPEIQFVRDLSAHPDKVVSFSDDAVPGALYLGLGSRTAGVDVYDLADSLIHEHRHQKLYLLGRRVELVAKEEPLVPSPWREELRPPSGLLHAAWVFVELQRFWRYLSDCGPESVQRRAAIQIETTKERLAQAWRTLAGVELTPAGRYLADLLEERSRG